jgi:hypothetical protein
MKNITAVLLPLACLLLLPKTHALSPAPDGGYPGGNTAEGYSALLSLTSGTYNTGIGWFSLGSVTTNGRNTAVGAGTLFLNTANDNTAIGAGALFSNSTGQSNTATGSLALFSSTISNSNTANGEFALFANNTGNANTAVGAGALSSNTTGGSNTALGLDALAGNTTGNGNTALGAGAGSAIGTASGVIAIHSPGGNVDSSTWIANIFGVTTVSGTTAPVVVSDAGQLGTVASSRRFKKDIKPMDKTSELILSLTPITFHYKSDTTNTAQFGLIAEDVANTNPDLVLRDKEGKPYTVRYDQINAMLLNEFIKEHRAFAEEKLKVQRLEATVAALATAVKEQTAQIQNVTDQKAARVSTPQIVATYQ